MWRIWLGCLLLSQIAFADLRTCTGLLLPSDFSITFNSTRKNNLKFIAPGSIADLKTPRGTFKDLIFLGRLFSQDGLSNELIFYSSQDKKVYLVDLNDTDLSFPQQEDSLGSLHPLVKSRNQVDATCSAYTMFNCFRQMKLQGSTALDSANQLEDEGRRQDLLVGLVFNIYAKNGSSFDVLSNYATGFGYKVFDIPRDKEFGTKILSYLKMGWPVVLNFDISPTMDQTQHPIYDLKNEKEFDRRLWLPRKAYTTPIGGRHAVLALAAIEDQTGKTKIVVMDPNWQVPRLWDPTELDYQETADIHAYVVWKDSTQ